MVSQALEQVTPETINGKQYFIINDPLTRGDYVRELDEEKQEEEVVGRTPIPNMLDFGQHLIVTKESFEKALTGYGILIQP